MNQQTPQVFLAPVNMQAQPQPSFGRRRRRNRDKKKKEKDKNKKGWKTWELFGFLMVTSIVTLPAAFLILALEIEVGKQLILMTAESLTRTFR